MAGRRRLRTQKTDLGYSMSTRKGESSVKSLLKKFGEAIFDAGGRGGGSGRVDKWNKK